MKNKTYFFLFLLFAHQSYSLLSKQTYPQEDSQLWLSAQIEYNLNKEIELQLSEEIRFYKNRSVLSQSLIDFGIAYKITDFFKAGIYYRYRILTDEDERRNEIYTNLTLKPSLGKLEISNRIRIHIKFKENKESINNLRDMLLIGYKIKDWAKPYIGCELFYRIFYEDGDRLTQGRYYLGLKSKLFKYHELDLFFMLEYEYNTPKAINSSVIGFAYTFNL